VTASNDPVAFIKASFRSAWALEVLAALRANRAEWLRPDQLVTSLRASDLVVRQSIESLVGARLVEINEAEEVRYAPASSELDELAAAAEQLYAKSPAFVRRTIVAAATPGIVAFSDAFRLKKD
jgi:hypothetical protein